MNLRKTSRLLVTLLVGLSACSTSQVSPISAQRPPASDRKVERIIFDTDGAVFWDDGAALAMLLRHPDKFHIEGITMALGNHWPQQGAEYIARVLKVFGRTDIPLHLGPDHPLKNSRTRLLRLEKNLIAKGLVGKSGFWKGAFSRPKEILTRDRVEPAKGESLTGVMPANGDAVTFIIEALRNSSEPITFVEIGPLTNLASALKKDPSIAGKINRVLIMGGVLHEKGNTTPSAELNFLIDPEAARIVLDSRIREKLLFPLDLSNQVKIDRKRFEDLVDLNTPLSNMLRADRGPKFQDSSYTLQAWDTTVAAYLIDPTYITSSESLSLRVDDAFGDHYGSVRIDKTATGKVTVMTRMNEAKFFEILKREIRMEAEQP